jgi:hypothetical protein
MVERRSLPEVGKHEQQQYDYRLRLGAPEPVLSREKRLMLIHRNGQLSVRDGNATTQH